MPNHPIRTTIAVCLLMLCMLTLGVFAVGPITVTNAADLVEKAIIDQHTRAVYSVAWSPDGRMLASGSDDCTIRMMDTQTWNVTHRISAGRGAIWCVAWSPDGSRLASASADGFVRIWDPQTGEQLLEVPGSPVFSVAWSPDGQLLASGHANGTVTFIDPITGERTVSWRGHIEGGHSTEVIGLAWSPDGTTLASGGIDYAVRLWDREGNALAVFRANTQARNDINGLAWSPDGSMLAAAGQAASIRIWDVASERQAQLLSHIPGTWTRGVAYSPNGTILATTGSDSATTLWDVSTGLRLMTLRGHDAPVWSVAWSPDGSLLATGSGFFSSGSGDTSVRIWGL